MNKLILFFFISFSLLTYSYGQSSENNNLNQSLDSLLSPEFKPNEPGIVIFITRQGKIVYEKALGSADIELNTPLQTDMIFRIGSITKQFTAVAILQLVEQGKISSLQDSVQKYVKDFPAKSYNITIENLLTNTSGIPDYTAYGDSSNVAYIERHDFTGQQIINYFKNQPLQFKPGTKYDYSNSNFALLAYIIEKISGEDYHKYMDEKVIKAAGLTNTLYASETTIVPKRVTGYTRDKGFYENADYQSLSMGYGCGDLMSTVEDLYKWNTALLSYKLIKKETLEKAFTPFKLNNGSYTRYGYGWFIDSIGGSKCIHHEGQVNGFIAEEKYFPKEDIYVGVITNVKSPEDTTDFSTKRFKLMNDISLLALGKKLRTDIQPADNILNRYVGIYRFSTSKKRLLTISKKDDYLMADISGQGSWRVLFQSTTKFIFEGIDNGACEFIIENGKVSKIIVSQNGQYIWNKIQ